MAWEIDYLNDLMRTWMQESEDYAAGKISPDVWRGRLNEYEVALAKLDERVGAHGSAETAEPDQADQCELDQYEAEFANWTRKLDELDR